MNPCKALSSHAFGSSGLTIRKSALGYFNKVVAMAFWISSLTKFKDSARGMLPHRLLQMHY